MPDISDTESIVRLARQDLANGRLADAQDKCLQVLSTHRHHPSALQALGEALSRQGRDQEAVRVFGALTLIQPMVAGHWQNLGTALRPTRAYDQALAAFERALRLGPPSADLLYNLGVLQMSRCDYQAAHFALRDAVALAPREARIRWAFAQCCFDFGRLDEALQTLEGWQKLDGLTVELTVMIVLLLVMMGMMHDAQAAVEQLLTAPPPQGKAALSLATILERVHRLDEARAVLDRLDNEGSLDGDPEKLVLSAVLADRAGQHEESYRQLSSALRSHQEFVHRHHVLYPLARAADACGRYEEAFAAAEEAHRSQIAFLEAVIGPVPVEESQIYTLTAQGSDPGDVAAWADIGPHVGEDPIFIVGFPRSGTTLLEQVLDAHPMLQSMDEQPFLLKAVTELAEIGVRYPNELGKLGPQALNDIRARYWDRAHTRGRLQPGRRLVDKNPLNLILLPLIRRLFPDARIIVAIRHPCDTLLSCFMQHFRSPGLAIVCRDLTTLATAYSRALDFWYSQSLLLRPCSYELQYERLATDFPAEVRKLSAFLELPWDDAMLVPGNHARAKGFINTPSYAQVTQPVSDRSVGRWRHYQHHFSGVSAILEPWALRWGYSLDIPGP
jgi:tetratricopeptide (TPR) repeat protein